MCFATRKLVVVTGVALLLAIQQARAADEGISVTGVGTVKVRPTEVEIDGTVSGESELASDASVKFRDGRKKAIAAIDNLKNPDLTVGTDGSSIHEAIDPAQQQRMMQGQAGGDTTKSRIQLSEHLKLTLKNADQLQPEKLLDVVLKLIDTSRDAGLQVGPPPATNWYEMQQRAQNGGADALVLFKIGDTSGQQADAYKQAVADAREKAQRIADLTGVKLGRVLSVKDDGASALTNNEAGTNDNEQTHSVSKEVSSGTFGEIPISVRLQVQFEIAK